MAAPASAPVNYAERNMSDFDKWCKEVNERANREFQEEMARRQQEAVDFSRMAQKYAREREEQLMRKLW